MSRPVFDLSGLGWAAEHVGYLSNSANRSLGILRQEWFHRQDLIAIASPNLERINRPLLDPTKLIRPLPLGQPPFPHPLLITTQQQRMGFVDPRFPNDPHGA